ncbi:MAG TPA: tetratricopeptide repeat protein [Candidatus Limnocylindria bacterium]|nr:tetratricopeptide repeat protein [Candidatus Limnocylindria bacterium]
MSAPRPSVAVIPFGARGTSERAGAWARQLAARLVERFAADAGLELRPVFLVAMSESGGGAPGRETTNGAGYLVFGSSPGPDLAAGYAESLGTTFALTGTYREDGGSRRVEVTLVDAASHGVRATRTIAIGPGTFATAETALARWLARTVAARTTSDLDTPAAANDAAYAALLQGMDEEVTATLLRQSDPAGADQALERALAELVDAVIADPECAAAEERMLVLAAESLDRGQIAVHIRALESLTEVRPRSWRAHYVLGKLRAEVGEISGAIVSFEFAHSLRPLPDTDLVRLAELYANAGAAGPALGHLRRIAPSSDAYAAAQELAAVIALQRGDLPGGQAAFDRAVAAGATGWEIHASFGAALHQRGETREAIARYEAALAAGGPAIVRLNLARALFETDDAERAARELDTLLDTAKVGEVAGQARRMRFGIRHRDLEQALEDAGKSAIEGDATRFAEARTAFDRALAVEPDLWEAHFGLGILARHRGDPASALGSFRRVLALWPEQADALHELGVALLMTDAVGEAVDVLERASALRPRDAAYLADAGFARLRAGDLATARERLEYARDLDAADPITRGYLDELERIEAGVAAEGS